MCVRRRVGCVEILLARAPLSETVNKFSAISSWLHSAVYNLFLLEAFLFQKENVLKA